MGVWMWRVLGGIGRLIRGAGSVRARWSPEGCWGFLGSGASRGSVGEGHSLGVRGL